MTEPITCPDCNGTGIMVAFHARMADGTSRYNMPLTCLRCKGAKTVPAEMLDWMRRGKLMRDWWVGIYRNLRDESKRRGMTAVDLSAMESGRVEPVFSEAMLRELNNA